MNELSFDPRRTVLIGDTSQERFRLLEKILLDDFHLHVQRFPNFTDLRVKAESGNDWLLILIADDLHLSAFERENALSRYFIKLEDRTAHLGCLVGGRQAPDLGVIDRLLHLYVPRAPSINDPRLRTDIIAGLMSLGRRMPQPISLPDMVFKTDDRTLREQIRSLNEHRNLIDGKETLKHLIRWFFDEDNVTIERLGQGLSGAKVFLVRVGEEEDIRSYVLKLGSEDSLWKLEQEAKKHEQARSRTGVRYRMNLPLLHPCLDSAPFTYIARYKSWAAVCYDYLGNSQRKGGIIDLETLLVCSHEELSRRTSGTGFHQKHLSSGASLTECRDRILGAFLDWLSKEWHQEDDRLKREDRELWLTQDCPPTEYPVLPPYRLKGKEKGWILDFLDSKDAEKVSRLLPEWDEHRNSVWEFVEKEGPTGLSALDEPTSVVLSPAHGDLNANNAILWLDYLDQPFLIDFPFFQESGHALQDFARLEVEIIFALMECQAESAHHLPARDHSYSQLRLWRELADHLLMEDKWEKKKEWADHDFTANIEHCLGLIQQIRRKAKDVQGHQGGKKKIPVFFAEYLPALLYYTLREIGYPSRTVFKRLLAVYSASQIITRLYQLSAARHRM